MADVNNIENKTLLAKDATLVESTPIRSEVIDTGTDVVIVSTTVGPNTIPYFDENKEYVAKELNDFGDMIISIPSVSDKIDEAAETAATEAATKAAQEAVGPATAQAEEYRNEAELFKNQAADSAAAAQNISDANTYYITPTDPDGTIAGLAGTPSGKYFRVMQGAGASPSQIYYLNNDGVAVRVADVPGQASIDALTQEVNGIEPFNPSFNLFNNQVTTDGYYLFEGTGVPTANAQYCYSDYIPVAANAVYSSRNSTRVATFYDKNRTYISDVSSTFSFTTPANAAFMRVSVLITNKSTYQVTFGTGSEVYKPFVGTVAPVNNGAPVSLIPSFGFKPGKNKFNYADAQQGTHISVSGTVTTDTDVSRTVSELIPVDQTKTYFCNQQYPFIAYYDSKGVFISRTAVTNWNTSPVAPIILPAGTAYIRIEVPNAVVTATMIAEVVDNGRYEDYELVAPDKFSNSDLSYAEVEDSPEIFTHGLNLFNKTVADKGYINEWGSLFPLWPETGTQYIHSDYIKITESLPYKANLIMRFIAFYDANYMWLSTTSSVNNFVAPAGAKYVRVTINNTQKDTFILTQGEATPTFEDYKHVLRSALDDGHSVSVPGSLIDQTSLSINFVNQGLFEIGKNKYNKATSLPGYINESGVIVPGGTSYVYSDFIPVISGTNYVTNYGFRFLALYDANKQFLRTIVGLSNSIVSFLVEEDTYFVRPSINYVWRDIVQLEEGTTVTEYEEYQYVAIDTLDGIPVSYGTSATPPTTETTPDTYGVERLREFHMRSTKKKFGGSEQLRVAFFGDSYTRGQTRYALKVANYFWNKFNGTAFDSTLPPFGYGYRSFGFDPNGDNSDIVGTNVIQTGFVCQYNTGNGPDISSVTSSTAGHNISTPLDTTQGYDVYLYFEGGSGVINITYPNGATPEQMDFTTYTTGMQVVKLTVPVNGTGNIVFTVVSGTVRMYGMSIEKPDANSVIFHKLGGSGSNSRQWAAVDSTRFVAAVQALKPNFATIMLGTNDQGSQLSYGEFKANIETMIDRIRQGSGITDILIICPAENNRPGGNTVPMTRYAQAMYDIAKSDRDVAFLNLQNSFGEKAADYAYGSARSWMVGDNIHPDPNTGGYAISGAIIRIMDAVS